MLDRLPIVRFLSHGTTESPRRLIAYRSAMVLLIIACALTAVISYQGMSLEPVDNGLLTAFGALNLTIAGLAREIYRKPESVGAEAPPAPSPVVPDTGRTGGDQ